MLESKFYFFLLKKIIQILLGIFKKTENLIETVKKSRSKYEKLANEHIIDPRSMEDVDVNEFNPLMQSESVLKKKKNFFFKSFFRIHGQNILKIKN